MTKDQIEAIQAIKKLAIIALNRHDVDLLHEHIREIVKQADKVLQPPAR